MDHRGTKSTNMLINTWAALWIKVKVEICITLSTVNSFLVVLAERIAEIVVSSMLGKSNWDCDEMRLSYYLLKRICTHAWISIQTTGWLAVFLRQYGMSTSCM